MSAATNSSQSRVSADDLQRKLQSFQDGIQGKVDDQRNTLVTVGGAALVVLLMLMFLLGKRSGRKKSTLVEIRRL